MTVDAYDAIRREVHVRIDRRRLRPDVDLEAVRGEVGATVDEYQRAAMLGEHLPLADPSELADRVLRSITELGPLTDLLARRDVEEIFVEGPRVTYLDDAGRLRGLSEPTTEEENRLVVERLLAATERQLNAKHPMVQARVLDGTARLTAAIPPIADHLSATLRRYTVRNVSLDALVARDVKGLYKKALAGEIKQFTGVSDPYEPPAAPDLVLKTDEEEPHESARKVIEKLEFFGYLPTKQDPAYRWDTR
jgi:hypothetical protein